jgi:hypothetical protein
MPKFVIVGVQRIGSSALSESLGLHPDVTCGWEWTSKVPWRLKIEAAEKALSGDFSLLPFKHQQHMSKVFKGGNSWLGFKRLFRASGKWVIHTKFCPALWADRLEDHLRWFARRPDIHVIHIVRIYNIEWLKSVYVARKTQLYGGKQYPDHTKVKIPLLEGVARLQTKDWVDTRLGTLKNTNPYFRAFYEDFLDDPNTVSRSCLRFMGCDPSLAEFERRQKKRQSKFSAKDYVFNFEEISERLSNRGFSTSCLHGAGGR